MSFSSACEVADYKFGIPSDPEKYAGPIPKCKRINE